MLALFSTRLELFSLEAREERDRAVSLAAFAVIAAIAALLALMALSAFVVVLFWDEHRLAALAGVTIVYLLVALWAVQRLKSGRGDAPAPFAATLAELKRDAAWLSKRGNS